MAAVDHFQGFEVDASAWFDSDDNWVGLVVTVPSGSNDIVSAHGSNHAEVSDLDAGYGPFSRFGGYADEFPGTFTAQLDVYLDPEWEAGTGFDYSVAANGADNAHQRDYIIHVAKDISTGQLLVGASNNTNFTPRQNLETLANHYAVADAGWYTVRHTFYDDGGFLSVDIQLVDVDGAVLFSETRGLDNGGNDPIEEVGGNRYAWFTSVEGLTLAVDNHQLCLGRACAPPMPASVDDCKKGGWESYGVFRNQGDCVSYVWTGGKNAPRS